MCKLVSGLSTNKCKLFSGRDIKFLAVDSMPHYTDTTPITAAVTWKYRAMYIINDEQVGQWSDAVSITVG